MRVCKLLGLVLCVLVCAGCGHKKSTQELITDLKSSQEKDRIVAVRLLPQRPGDAPQTVPALILALKDRESDIRRSAAIGLGKFGQSATEAIPALKATLTDRDARVREAARIALSRIDPTRFAASTSTKNPRKVR